MSTSDRDLERSQSRVRFASGPFEEYPDGHPPVEGQGPPPKQPGNRSSSGATIKCDLTRYNVGHLARVLGSDYLPSINRLKRRLGMAVPLKAPLKYLTTFATSNRPNKRTVVYYSSTKQVTKSSINTANELASTSAQFSSSAGQLKDVDILLASEKLAQSETRSQSETRCNSRREPTQGGQIEGPSGGVAGLLNAGNPIQSPKDGNGARDCKSGDSIAHAGSEPDAVHHLHSIMVIQRTAAATKPSGSRRPRERAAIRDRQGCHPASPGVAVVSRAGPSTGQVLDGYGEATDRKQASGGLATVGKIRRAGNLQPSTQAAYFEWLEDGSWAAGGFGEYGAVNVGSVGSVGERKRKEAASGPYYDCELGGGDTVVYQRQQRSLWNGFALGMLSWRSQVRHVTKKAVGNLGILATGIGGVYGAYHLVVWAGLAG